MSGQCLIVEAVIRGKTGQLSLRLDVPKRIDLQFIYRAGMSVDWDPAGALLEDRASIVESSAASASRLARALREEYGLALQPSRTIQWTDFGPDERDGVASVLFESSVPG